MPNYLSTIKKVFIGGLVASIMNASDHRWIENTGLLFNYAHYSFGDLPDYSGYLAGLHVDFEHRYKECVRTEVRFDGAWNAGHICAENDLKANINDFRTMFDIGYIMTPCSDTWSVTPYLGFEFVYLSNKLCPQDVTYKYYLIYVPIGFLSEWKFSDEFSAGLSFQYEIEAWQNLTMRNPNIVPLTMGNCCKDMDIELTRSYGIHIEMPFTRQLVCNSNCYELQTKLVPFFDWHKFGEAKACNNQLTPLIPHLTEWYLGVHWNIGIRF